MWEAATLRAQARMQELQTEERAARGGGLCGGEGGGGALGLAAASYEAQLRREARATLRERLRSVRLLQPAESEQPAAAAGAGAAGAWDARRGRADALLEKVGLTCPHAPPPPPPRTVPPPAPCRPSALHHPRRAIASPTPRPLPPLSADLRWRQTTAAAARCMARRNCSNPHCHPTLPPYDLLHSHVVQAATACAPGCNRL